jgi:spore maturation protein CgeB
MKILYCGIKYDYSDRSRGFSFEHNNFYNTLLEMNSRSNHVDYICVDEVIQQYGKEFLNNKIYELVKKKRYDLVFFFLFKDEYDLNLLKFIKNELSIPTIGWMSDDHWRFDSYSKKIAKYFTLVVTTDKDSIAKYHKNNIYNVFNSQWAFNNFSFTKKKIENYTYNVSFVGISYGTRRNIINFLKENNLHINCWGYGWEEGRINQDQMCNIFSKSCINLNFSLSADQFSFKKFFKIFFHKDNKNKINFNYFRDIILNSKNFIKKTSSQIKARVFEVTGCGGFLLTEYATHLEEYFDIKKEIAIFYDKKDLKDKIKFFLKNSNQSKLIANNGYLRTIKDHTYEKRFNEIFNHLLR